VDEMDDNKYEYFVARLPIGGEFNGNVDLIKIDADLFSMDNSNLLNEIRNSHEIKLEVQKLRDEINAKVNEFSNLWREKGLK
jgi:hypothetical protein